MNADPLHNLRPLHLPEAVGWWPPAPGWWLLAAVLALLLLAAIHALWRWLRRNRYRRIARRELQHAYQQSLVSDTAAAGFAAAASRILRRAALSRYPRHEVAALCAEDWLRFLENRARGLRFCEGPGAALALAPYDPRATTDNAALLRVCSQWLGRHR